MIINARQIFNYYFLAPTPGLWDKQRMNAAIFYGSKVKLTNAHKPVHNNSQPPNGTKQPEYFVRMKMMAGCDALTALNRAKPLEGELLLNTCEFE